MSPGAPSDLDKVLEFQRRTVELVADEVEAIPEGWVARTPSLPAVWWLNQVRVSGPIGYEEANALCRRHQSEAGYHQIHLDHNLTGEDLAESFKADGWKLDVELHSVLAREPDRAVDTSRVIEPEVEEALSLMERWIIEDENIQETPDGVAQLVQSNRLTMRRRNAQRLGVRGPGGELVASTFLFSDGVVAQVENVYVVPEARGHGHARALVTRAVDLAREGGHDMTFIVADDTGWPKHLYAKVGFEAVGRTWEFHRKT